MVLSIFRVYFRMIDFMLDFMSLYIGSFSRIFVLVGIGFRDKWGRVWV